MVLFILMWTSVIFTVFYTILALFFAARHPRFSLIALVLGSSYGLFIGLARLKLVIAVALV
jgi:membrane-associated PAP2 superfamily phosphatase